jgi:hypothetical protein
VSATGTAVQSDDWTVTATGGAIAAPATTRTADCRP